VAREVAQALPAGSFRLVCEKSTVPVQTGDQVAQVIAREGPPAADYEVASNPEFLREGSAVHDTLNPDRIVVGTDTQRGTTLLAELYRPIVEATGCELLATDRATAELIKHASNAFLATKISFINTVAAICERSGADVALVARGMGLDPRIGPQFLEAGAGYGGSCFPKDVAAFAHRRPSLGSTSASCGRRPGSTWPPASGSWTRSATPSGTWPASGSACSAWPSSPRPTTSGRRRPWTSSGTCWPRRPR
jgi:UDPglucose 6-dehydrogenase